MQTDSSTPDTGSQQVTVAKTNRRTLLQLGTIAAVGSTALGAISRTVFAQATPDATPVTTTSLPPNCTILTEGLRNPRYLAIADDGSIFITEAGAATDLLTVDATPVAGTPVPAESIGARGNTGFVSNLAPDGAKSVVASGLPAYLTGAEITGPAGIALVEGKIVFVNGGSGPLAAFIDRLPDENSVISIDPATGAATNVADIGQFEIEHNPDPNTVESNCFDLLYSNGFIYIADAGGNTIYTFDPATNELNVLTVIPGLPGTEPNPKRQNLNEIDPAPAGLAMQDDGTLLVGMLSGDPFAPGAAGIVKVAPDGMVSNWAGGLTMVVDVAVAPDGTVYATQMSTDFLAEPRQPGNIVRLRVDGSSEIVLDGLNAPQGLTFDVEGNLYVVANSFGASDGGVIVKCTDPVSLPGTGVATVAEAVAPGATIEALDMRFEPKEFEVPADTEFTLVVKNAGQIPHDFKCDPLGLSTGTIDSGAEATVTINAPAGSYQFYCSIIGHRQAGMIGTVHVN